MTQFIPVIDLRLYFYMIAFYEVAARTFSNHCWGLSALRNDRSAHSDVLWLNVTARFIITFDKNAVKF